MSSSVLLASERGEIGLPEAMDVLRAGGRAIDAVEAAVRAAEANPDDHYVGVGGIPNLLGVLELDASIMDGRTRAAGAVGAVRGFAHPISIARRVLEELPQHVLLVGEGAERFARALGFQEEETLTDEALEIWRTRLEEPSWEGAESEGDRRYREEAVAMLKRLGPPDGPWGTVNVVAARPARRSLLRRQHERLSVEASRPYRRLSARRGRQLLRQRGRGGRLHGARRARDPGLHGAGNVWQLAAGAEPEAACLAALRDAASLADEFRAPLNVLALAPDGRHGAASTHAGATYAVMTEDMAEPDIRERAVL